jgi:hypothetical protein
MSADVCPLPHTCPNPAATLHIGSWIRVEVAPSEQDF